MLNYRPLWLQYKTDYEGEENYEEEGEYYEEEEEGTQWGKTIDQMGGNKVDLKEWKDPKQNGIWKSKLSLTLYPSLRNILLISSLYL